MSEERTVCLVVLAKVGKWVKADVTMEMYMRPTQNQMGTGEYGWYERRDSLDTPIVPEILNQWMAKEKLGRFRKYGYVRGV